MRRWLQGALLLHAHSLGVTPAVEAHTEGATDVGNDDCAAEDADTTSTFVRPSVCNIERVHISQLSVDRFIAEYNDQKPVVVVQDEEHQAYFTKITERDAILDLLGDELVTLGTANTHTGHVTKQTTLREYFEYVPALARTWSKQMSSLSLSVVVVLP